MKFVVVRFSNDDRFKIPFTVIAHDRAKYYAGRDNPDESEGSTKWQETYARERAYTLGSEEEILDWLWNNMNWEDVQQDAEKYVTTDDQYVYEEHWNEISENDDNVEIIEE